MESELPPQYDPAAHEPAVYQRWKSAGVFTARAECSERAGGDRAPFTIVIPPPNVTAVLHMGHGLNNTVQDVLVRWRRMAGDEALWVPGTDHAGIATQNVIEKQLGTEGSTRFDLGRAAFVQRTERFVSDTGGVILEQLAAIGASCDWTRTAYTLSPELSRAVREAFVRLYQDGLIYKGHRVIHWCPRCLTSLSDEEAEFEESEGKLYHIAYPVVGEEGRTLIVATTRPETMLGDVALAVHPDDERYAAMIGKRVLLPVANIEIPVIADEYVDPSFGTGVVKITPAHDANDFEVGLRHSLAMPVVIDATAHMAEVTDAAGRVPEELRGLDRFAARDRIVELLKESGILVKVEAHQHSVRHCYRCGTVVEPRLSDQWFVKMAPLAKPALEAVRDGTIRLVPERWEGVYVHWMENIRDWNISRQLWWGHRIPVWYCDACGGEPIVSREDITACPACGGAVRQDEDVLDTWFSSWLWPLSTLGWPNEDAEDLRAFYPTDVLVTAPEILFFWVARMIMAGYFFAGRAPFHTVLLHGTVRDMEHRKMSKSLGNGIDPLDVVRLYGADALRFTVISGMGLGTDVMLDPSNLEQSFAPGRNFATKLWNIGRFLLSNIGDEQVASIDDIPGDQLVRADQWILERLDQAIGECDAALGRARPANGGRWPSEELHAGLRLNDYAETARRFVWNELADWYVESVKPRMAGSGHDRDVARAVLAHVFDGALRLLHPVVPFITETLWQRLPGRTEGEFLARAAWPRRRARVDDEAREGAADFELVREAVVGIRQARAEYDVPPGKIVDATLAGATPRVRELFSAEAAVIGQMARAKVGTDRGASDGGAGGAAVHSLLSDGSQLTVPLAGVVDIEKECARLGGELERLESQLAGLAARLANEKFVTRAKPEVVDAERRKHEEWTARREQLRGRVKALCGA
ncbi:MAG TPA: valine--tRNA ligase [Gemmatimonadaceae bacterium]|nr:valine--tRNA ligase [Gemmatimonadaceae bacterium]